MPFESASDAKRVNEVENRDGDERKFPSGRPAREIIREPARDVRRLFFAFAFPCATV
jgi:hypothetical protein